MNYIGFYENKYFYKINDCYKFEENKNISLSLNYEKNTKENLEEISVFLLDKNN